MLELEIINNEIVMEESYGVIFIFLNIDMEMMVIIGYLIYINIDFKNVRGYLVIVDEVIVLDNVCVNGLGGEFVMSGSYEIINLEELGFSFKYDFSGL